MMVSTETIYTIVYGKIAEKEFAGHLEMALKIDLKIYFARPYHS